MDPDQCCLIHQEAAPVLSQSSCGQVYFFQCVPDVFRFELQLLTSGFCNDVHRDGDLSGQKLRFALMG